MTSRLVVEADCRDVWPEEMVSPAPPVMRPFAVRYPVARKLVDETEAREDWPATASVPADCKYPVAVRFVPEAFVKFKVGNNP